MDRASRNVPVQLPGIGSSFVSDCVSLYLEDQVGSGWAQGGVKVGSGWGQGGLRVGSGWAQGGLRVGGQGGADLGPFDIDRSVDPCR